MALKETRTDILIVGAGFGGMYTLHRARQLGFSAVAIEAGSGVGGTWYWNRYPGARCDAESMSYSYSFDDALQQEWSWSHRYSAQPEILAYANHVADRFDLRRDIVFDTRVTSASFDEAAALWRVRTDRGGVHAARYLVMATGCLSVPKTPDLPDIDRFAGRVLHTARWPHEGVDLSGSTVGLVGTGSSAIQAVPVIAREAAHLTVFQRTPNFTIPAWNGPLDPETEAAMKRDYPELRRKSRHSYAGDYAPESYVTILDLTPEEREEQFEKRWREGGFNYQYAFADLMTSPEANELAADFVRRKIRAIVSDPETAEALCPADHPIGTKRLCVDSDYWETYNRPNVALVDLRRDPLVAVTPDGIRTGTREHRFDTLVLATGFDAMTGALDRIEISGRGGRTLRDAWADGPVSYLGLCVAGFPNLFTLTGPGSPSVLTNMIQAIEQHVDWIGELLVHARERGHDVIEPTPEAQAAWTRRVAEGADETLYPQANSWYVGANVPGKPRVFMAWLGGFGPYADICDEIAAGGYEGFRLGALAEA